MAVYAIVGYRRTSDGVPGSWTPDVPEGIQFSSICGDTTATVARLRAGTDADSSTADPNRLAIVRTETPVLSLSRIGMGGDLDDELSGTGRFMAEVFARKNLPPGATVRDGIATIVEAWDDDDDEKPNRIRPNAHAMIEVRCGPDLVYSRPANRREVQGKWG